jgi:hypothetical protein
MLWRGNEGEVILILLKNKLLYKYDKLSFDKMGNVIVIIKGWFEELYINKENDYRWVKKCA